MRNLVYPYPTLSEDLELTISRAELVRMEAQRWQEEVKGQASMLDPRDIDLAGRVIDVSSEDPSRWRQLHLKVTVKAARHDVAFLSEAGTTSAILVASCGKTNMRQVANLSQEDEAGSWVGEIDIDRDSERGQVTMKAIVAEAPPLHRFLGESEPWFIYFDPPPVHPLSGTLLVQWAEFASDAAHPYLKAYRNQPYYADLTADKPTLYLNKGLAGFPELFEGPGRRPRPQEALVQAERMGIGRAVWMALFQTAVAGIRREEGEEPDWPEEAWQREILLKLLPNIYPDRGGEEALRSAYEDRTSDGIKVMESQALALICRDILKDGSVLRREIRLLEDSLREVR